MEENQQNRKISNPDILKWIIFGIMGFIITVLVFGIGVWVGTEKARFSYGWAESYHTNFGGPRMGFFGNWRELPAGDFIESHGSFGEIIKIDNDGFIIKGRDNTEKIITITEDTVIERLKDAIKLSDLKINDYVVVIGSPNDSGQIEAKLIRVLPPPPLSYLPKSFNNHY